MLPYVTINYNRKLIILPHKKMPRYNPLPKSFMTVSEQYTAALDQQITVGSCNVMRY